MVIFRFVTDLAVDIENVSDSRILELQGASEAKSDTSEASDAFWKLPSQEWSPQNLFYFRIFALSLILAILLATCLFFSICAIIRGCNLVYTDYCLWKIKSKESEIVGKLITINQSCPAVVITIPEAIENQVIK